MLDYSVLLVCSLCGMQSPSRRRVLCRRIVFRCYLVDVTNGGRDE